MAKPKGPLSKYSNEKKKSPPKPVRELFSGYPEKERVGIEDMKKDMLKMMDKIDRLEDAYKYLKKRIKRIDGLEG